MPAFDIIREITPADSFRIAAVRGLFDLQMEKIREHFRGNIDIEERDWNIGIIYGRSGTGKSTIARELFPDNYIKNYQYGASAVIDDMPDEISIKDICRIFNAVGFSSPPSWLKPYDILSTGEKMRVDIARAILENRELIVFDEFTSTVNREVAKIGSAAIAKSIRRMGKKFIAVSCHDDIIEWLEPDWTFCTNNFNFFLAENIKDQKSNWKSIRQEEPRGNYLGSIII